MQSKLDQRKRMPINIICYALGFILLAYLPIVVSENITQGLIIVFCYIPLFLFTRYLSRHGGMGWHWPD